MLEAAEEVKGEEYVQIMRHIANVYKRQRIHVPKSHGIRRCTSCRKYFGLARLRIRIKKKGRATRLCRICEQERGKDVIL